MRQAIVFLRGTVAGTLTEENPKSYIFRYHDDYFHNSTMPDICMSLSKKKQDGALNEIKVKMTNRILLKAKTILKDDPTFEFLDLLDEVVFPTNSDAVMIIAQFKAAMEQYKKKHYEWMSSSWRTID